ncbi:hypothetical protein RRG08_032084 [Elysia crispata]|uniref:Uncharacterized protein n=1 Tax=Elysia crispata TaxID=231223 RepID=A0AAE1DAP7_9GAST|nr:hypothetical protein RRG08_032084 [Elysia crispata]
MLLLSLLGGVLTKGVSRRTKQYLLLLILLVQESYGHLVLTYPPARQYPLDFSDNYRTRPPCGMPKIPELVSYTNIPAGSAVDLSWHIAYPHRGGSAFELRSNNEKVLWRYPWTGWILADDVSQLNISLVLPNEVCENCTLRMLKQAREWGGGYTFWSCTDINLVNTTIPDDERCSFRGNFDGSKCICDRTYEGDKCQYKNECVDDSDCSNNGQCIDTNSTRYPKLQCYCKAGWYGRACEKESTVNSPSQIDLQNYKHRSLADEYDLYHRILSDTSEVEVVLKAKSVTWVGIGWRSNSAGSTCQNFPVDGVTIAPGARPAPISNGEPEPTGEPNGEPSGSPEGEPTGEPEGEPTGEPEGEPTGEPKGEPEGEPTGEPEGEPSGEPEGEPTGEPEGEPTGEPEGEPTGEPKGEPTGEPKGEPTGEPKGEPEGEPTGEPEGEPTGKPEGEPTGEPEREPTGEPTGKPEGEPAGEPTGEPEGGPTREPNSESTSAPYVPNPCDGSCNSTRNCLFDVLWKHDKKSQILKFTMSAPGSSNQYLAIGFSTNKMMAKSDIVVGLMDSTQPLITDRWAESKSKPTVDKTGNLQNISGSFVKGELTFSFSRPLVSPDTVEDTDLTTKTCVYLLTAMGTSANNDITYHSSKRSSSNTFCFDKCPKYDDKSSSSEPTGEPEGEPTGEPNGEPTEKPTGEPTGEPNGEPSGEPKGEPTGEPNAAPSGEPNGEPTGEPNGEPSGEPKGEPTGEPKGEPTGEPKGETTGEPNAEPSGEPNGEPAGEPNGEPSGEPKGEPTGEPNGEPSGEPNGEPSGEPNGEPSGEPEGEPSGEPKGEPTGEPKGEPTGEPNAAPSGEPNGEPTGEPNGEPSGEPKGEPTGEPKGEPTGEPKGETTGEPNAEPSGEPNGEPAGEPNGEPSGEPKGEPTGEPNGEPSGEPNGEPSGEPNGEPSGEPEGEPTGEPNGEPSGEPKGEPTGEPNGEPSGEPKGEPTGEPNGEPSGEPNGEPSGEPEGEPTGEPNGEPSGEPKGEPTGEPEGETTGRGNLHAMDCIDIVIGTAKGQLSRIGDYYTRDRSTPLFDEEYGGKDDLTAAFGFEENGETTILFRRKLQATESTDWSIKNNLTLHACARVSANRRHQACATISS